MQSTSERRQRLLEVMSIRHHDTIENLAFEFQVHRRTIERDVEYLSISYPIYTIKGIGGGVYLLDGYRLGRKYLTPKQLELLERLGSALTGNDLEILQSIIDEHKMPNRGVNEGT